MDPAPIRHMPEELIPLADGAYRLGLAHDTARKQLSAGKLRGEKRGGRWWVWVPLLDASGTSSGMDPAQSGSDPASSGTNPDAVITRLESEVAFLRSELNSRSQEIQRKDQLLSNRDQLLRDALARIPPSVPPGETYEHAPVSEMRAPTASDHPAPAPDSLIDKVRRLLRLS